MKYEKLRAANALAKEISDLEGYISKLDFAIGDEAKCVNAEFFTDKPNREEYKRITVPAKYLPSLDLNAIKASAEKELDNLMKQFEEL